MRVSKNVTGACLVATYTRTVCAVVGVFLVGGGLSLTCSGAELWVVRTWVVLHAQGGVYAVHKRRVNSTTKLGRSIEAGLISRSLVLSVTLLGISNEQILNSTRGTSPLDPVMTTWN